MNVEEITLAVGSLQNLNLNINLSLDSVSSAVTAPQCRG